MGICIDSSTKFLKKLGYNVVRLPRAGIAPLQLIGVQRGEALELGTLDKLIVSSSAPSPTLKLDESVSSIDGQRSSALSANIGLNVLGGIIGAMGGNLGIDAAYKGAKTITFQYANVFGDSIAPLDAGRYLRDATVDIGNKIVEQYVLGNGRLYLITRTIKSKKFRVEAKSSSGGSVGVDVPVLQQVAGGKVKIEIDTSGSNAVTFEGEVPLIFGFQCLDVGVRDGVLSLENTASGSIAMAAGAEPSPIQLATDGLLELTPT